MTQDLKDYVLLKRTAARAALHLLDSLKIKEEAQEFHEALAQDLNGMRLVFENQWQPIDTAPRDGTKICVFQYSEPSEWCKHLYPDGLPSCDIVRWDPSLNPPAWTDGGQSEPDRNPTHWMPLPAAPKPEEK